MPKTLTTMLAALMALAACGGGDDDAEAADTTEPAGVQEMNLTVRVVADQSGLGCTESKERSGLDVSNGSRLTVTDADGSTVGTATFDLSPGLTPGEDTCDWTAVARGIDPTADFYTLDAGGELATVSLAELVAAAWRVEVRIAVDGSLELFSSS